MREVERRVASVELVEHAAQRVHVDRGVITQPLDALDVGGEHLGRGIVARRPAHDAHALRERRLLRMLERRVAEVDEAHVEGAGGHLLL